MEAFLNAHTKAWRGLKDAAESRGQPARQASEAKEAMEGDKRAILELMGTESMAGASAVPGQMPTSGRQQRCVLQTPSRWEFCLNKGMPRKGCMNMASTQASSSTPREKWLK